jgi:RHS repeat-associated protein
MYRVTNRKLRWAILGICLLCISGFRNVRAQEDAYVTCQNDFLRPLIAANFPHHPQTLNVDINILTDAQTPPNIHGVLVYDPDSELFQPPEFFFTVLPGGQIDGHQSVAYVDAKLCTAYYSTVIGTYKFQGDNFPFYGSTINDSFPPSYYHRKFYLDWYQGFIENSYNTDEIDITADYDYTDWALISYLFGTLFSIEGPYIPNCPDPPPTSTAVGFSLIGPAPNQPYFCPVHCCGMAVASLDRFQSGIAISDTPISYAPGVGPSMAYTIAYHQRYTSVAGGTPNYSNMGPQWHYSWLSYIEGGPSNQQEQAVEHDTAGNQYTYTGYEQDVVQQAGGAVIAQGDFQDNQGWTHATLHYRQGPERYELWQPDGAKQIFAEGVGSNGNRLFFLTAMQDAQGNVTTINYDSAAATNGQAVITSVTDSKGGQLIFSYGSSDRLKITKVTRSCDGLSANFTYSSSGQLVSSTDTDGITSSFGYESGDNFISSMTTPYGTTTFHSRDRNGSWEADITNPLGQNERVEYQNSSDISLVAASDSHVPSASGLTIDNNNLNTNNTYYWSRRAIADATAAGDAVDSAGFYALAQTTHWAQSQMGTIAVPLCTKKPLEGRVWYNYPNQPSVDQVEVNWAGSSTSPSVTARVLDGGETQYSSASYNSMGRIAQSVDPVGRTTNYTYDTNGIDLLQVAQVNGSGEDTLSTITYNSQHLPLTVTDASGQVTTMTYNNQGQLLTRTNAKSETTTLGYYTSGYLETVTGPVTGAMTSYTYDSTGRVHTVTDSEGYVLTMSYDNDDRPVTTTYPDGTSDQTSYDKLDVGRTIDRQGRTTYNRYDAIRELLQTTDPLGRTTKYTWCTCGGLSTLTDANGNITTWNLDTQGRVTGKVYADSSQNSYAYESNAGRLHSMTDARGDVAVYAYNVDNTLASTTYTSASGVASTSNVSFAYDTVYKRVTAMTDGTGTTSYSYNAVPANAASSPTTGAGALASISVPIAGSSATVDYGYDQLGRVASRTVDGSSEVDTTFDSMGRVTNVSNSLGAFAYAYVDETSRLSGISYPSNTGLSTSYSYLGNTGDQRLQDITNSIGDTVLSKFDYTYNAVGTIATWKQQVDANTPMQYALTYDATDQVVDDEQTNTSTEARVSSNKYGYDPAGNRLAETTLSTTNTGRFNNLNQLQNYGPVSGTQTVAGNTSGSVMALMINGQSATVTSGTNFAASVPLPNGTNVVSVVAKPSSGSSTTQRFQVVNAGTVNTLLTYDADGNALSDESGNAYKWDTLDRLVQITYPSGAASQFAYDGLNRRIQIAEINSSGTVTSTKNYLWIGQEMAEERDASNTVTKRFFPQGEQQGGLNYYYTRDHLGSVREMLNSSGTIVARYGYDSYGRTTLVSGTNLATEQYAAMYLHQPSGLFLTRAGDGLSTGRAYDPNTGRWLSRDPIGERWESNLYDYVDDDPIDQMDSTGLMSPRCIEAMKQLNDAINDAVKQLERYNPVTDAQGGVPILRGGNPIGRDTVPGGHAVKGLNAINRVVNALNRVAAECKNDLPPPACPGPLPTPSPIPAPPAQARPPAVNPAEEVAPATDAAEGETATEDVIEIWELVSAGAAATGD